MNTTDFDDAVLDVLQAPISPERPWMVFAACREEDPDLWFSPAADEIDHAVAVCSTCTVRAECLEYSLEANERFGVWGGLTDKERRRWSLKRRSKP